MHNCNVEIINKTPNGKVFACSTCDKIHIEYKNLNFVFSANEFKFFREYFNKLDAYHWAELNKNSHYSRKVMIPIGHSNFTAIFHIEEILEMKQLLKENACQTNTLTLLNLKNIESEIALN